MNGAAPLIETIEERVAYENDFVTVYDDLVRFPDGHVGTYFRSRWKSPHGAAVVPVIGDEVLLVRSFRYAERAYSVEIPQGFGLAGASPEDDARRELREEAGLDAGALEPLFVTGNDYQTHVFLARLPADTLPTHAGQEATESIAAFVRMPVREISLAAIREAGIHEPVTIAALLAVSTLSGR